VDNGTQHLVLLQGTEPPPVIRTQAPIDPLSNYGWNISKPSNADQLGKLADHAVNLSRIFVLNLR
jgi:hypothetical protein